MFNKIIQNPWHLPFSTYQSYFNITSLVLSFYSRNLYSFVWCEAINMNKLTTIFDKIKYSRQFIHVYCLAPLNFIWTKKNTKSCFDKTDFYLIYIIDFKICIQDFFLLQIGFRKKAFFVSCSLVSHQAKKIIVYLHTGQLCIKG